MTLLKYLAIALTSMTGIFAYSVERIISADKVNVPIIHDNALTQDQSKTLRLVTLVLRHGNRNPQDTYPNDPYINDSMEPYGWGQLTTKGRKKQYNQGLYLRDRYNDFLGTKYSPDIFWLQSTEPDRAKMSALLEASALWKPNKEQTFNSDLSWQPVTLHYQRRKDDNLLLIWATCPEYERAKSLLLNSPEIKQIDAENSQLYEELSNYTGHTIASAEQVFDLYSTLYAERDVGLKLPKWTEKYFPNQLTKLSQLSLDLNSYNEELKKMVSAPLITEIVTNMNKKAEGTLKPENRKMFMYVGHDSTIVNLLNGLGVWDKQIPGYNIMTMIELHETDSGWKVEMYLRNSTEVAPVPLTLPGCEFSCPLEQFNQLLRTMIIKPEEWRQLCTLKDSDFVQGDEPAP